MGKGMTVLRNPHRKLVPDMKGWIMQANITEEINNGNHSRLLHDVSNIEEPCAGKPHAGIWCAMRARLILLVTIGKMEVALRRRLPEVVVKPP
jgi:hypothetical protein